jgi:glucose-6-phosphate isomerase
MIGTVHQPRFSICFMPESSVLCCYMQRTAQQLWERFQKFYKEFPSIGLAIDISRVDFPDDFFEKMARPMQKSLSFMDQLENGAIANPDENRMVGHYWLRNPALAPSAEIRREIETTVAKIKSFVADVHSGRIKGSGGTFHNLLVIGIGGSALGPEFVSHALGNPATDKLKPFFFDNTDPDGMDKVLSCIGNQLNQTLCIVISKSGETPETRNGMLEAQAAYKRAGLDFGKHAVAITQEGSKLDLQAKAEGWIERFPMWDWVGGRTSETSAVGLLPAALQGLDIDGLLKGAKECDEITRNHDIFKNPAAQMALMWHFIGNGRGEKDMVILPYKDRLELFSRYLQQLVMESLGKELDLDGKKVCQGLSVFGNKGSTDQHAYVQQLRDGLNNFFVVFVEVLKERKGASLMLEPEVTSGNYLEGFFLGTRSALYENGRQSITITLTSVSAVSVGVLIALFERAVGLYAQLVNINAYHQPGVQAGKKAAAKVLALQSKVIEVLKQNKGKGLTAAELAKETGDPEMVFKICEHLAANERMKKTQADKAVDAAYSIA